MKVFSRLKITATELKRLNHKSSGWVEFESFFSKPLSDLKYFYELNRVLTNRFGKDWQDNLYQNTKDNISISYEQYLKKNFDLEQKKYIGNGLVGVWYWGITLNNKHQIFFLQFEEPKSPPTKMLVIRKEDLKYLR